MAQAATEHNTAKGSAIILTEDTSAANSAVTVTTTAKTHARKLRSVDINASGSATSTVTVVVRRQLASSTIDVALANLDLSSATDNRADYDIFLAPEDVVEVAATAGGASVTVSIVVIEENA